MTKLEELFGILPTLTFHENDLSTEVYENFKTEVDISSRQYFNNPASRRNRTLETIFQNTWNGLVAEKYLIQEHGFVNDNQSYRDVKKNTIGTEIKTAVSSKSKQDSLDRLDNAKTKHDYVIFFRRKGKEYQIESLHQYDFDKNKYVQIESYCVY